jgi:hypothetical protein
MTENHTRITRTILRTLLKTELNEVVKLTYKATSETEPIFIRYWISENIFPANELTYTYVKRDSNGNQHVQKASPYNLLRDTYPNDYNGEILLISVTTKRTHQTPLPFLTTQDATYTCPDCPNTITCHPWKREVLLPKTCTCGNTEKWEYKTHHECTPQQMQCKNGA